LFDAWGVLRCAFRNATGSVNRMTSTLEDRVRTVIEQVAESQAAFAALIGLATDKLSKSLSGKRRFTSLELALIAEAGGVTVDWLLHGRVPTRPLVAARRTAEAGPTEVPELVDRCATAYETVDLLDGAADRPAPAEPAHDPRDEVDRLDGEALAALAIGALTAAGHPSIADLGIAELIEAAERVFTIDVTVDRLPPGLDGLAWQTDRHRLCVLGATRQWTRQRFTFAHELGHLLAGHARSIRLDQHLAPGREGDPDEALANRFAAALLMPVDELSRALPRTLDGTAFAQLVVRFRVSPSAMAVRLRALHYIDDVQYRTYRAFTSLECHETAGSVTEYVSHVNAAAAVRLPNRLVGTLFEAYRRGETTLRPLAHLLGIDVDDLRTSLSGGLPDDADLADEPVYAL
jgi:Zn-dependent peptidase ImmA (M78 family)